MIPTLYICYNFIVKIHNKTVRSFLFIFLIRYMYFLGGTVCFHSMVERGGHGLGRSGMYLHV